MIENRVVSYLSDNWLLWLDWLLNWLRDQEVLAAGHGPGVATKGTGVVADRGAGRGGTGPGGGEGVCAGNLSENNVACGDVNDGGGVHVELATAELHWVGVVEHSPGVNIGTDCHARGHSGLA